nr:MAG TPA: hypothetical protein [Caudoviricetes sp.]
MSQFFCTNICKDCLAFLIWHGITLGKITHGCTTYLPIAAVVLHFVLHRKQKYIICDIFIEQVINIYNSQTRINARFQCFRGFVSFYFNGFDSRCLLLKNGLFKPFFIARVAFRVA